MSYGIVYCVTNDRNGMKYISATTRTLEYVRRRYSGRRDSYRNGPVFKAIREFGPESFSVTQLCSARDKPELMELKRRCIESNNSRAPSGYNDSRIARAAPTPVLCVEKGVIYETVSQAARSASCDAASLLRAIRARGTIAGCHWKYFVNSPKSAMRQN